MGLFSTTDKMSVESWYIQALCKKKKINKKKRSDGDGDLKIKMETF